MASLYDSASLVMIPSGVKEDKLFSIKPTDGSGDFTFSRGSDIQATRVNSSGLIEKAKENLLLQSNQFDTTWVTSNASVTGGQSGYDGSSDAWLLNTTSSGGSLYQSYTNTGVHSVSVYAKKGTANGIRVRLNQTTDTNVYVDLRDGSVFTSGNTIDIDIQDVGSGWYRVTLSALFDSGISTALFYPTDGEAVSVAGNIYIQDAQLNHGLIAQDYVETTTTAVVEGLTADLPRLDYSGGASCPSLLLEPSRTNNIPQSEYFGSGSGWSLLNNVTIGDFVLSPEGKMNATELVFDGTTGGRIERTIGGLTAAADYSVSIYARVASGTQDVVFGATADATYTLTTEWQRLTRTEAENDTNAYPRFRCDDAATIEIFAFQHEAGSYPTSYIPTYGTAANRGADSCVKTGIADLVGSQNGTIFLDFVYDNNFANTRIFSLSGLNWIANGSIRLEKVGTKFKWNFTNAGAGTGVLDSTTDMVQGTRYKMALSYTETSASLFINGTKEDTDSVTTSSSMTGIFLNELGGGYSDIYEFQKNLFNQVVMFQSTLTDAECIALTTL